MVSRRPEPIAAGRDRAKPPQGIMAPMRRSGRRFRLVLLFALSLAGGCAVARPEWLQKEDEACFARRDFTEEVPQMYWGDPVQDPCWRYRGRLGPTDS